MIQFPETIQAEWEAVAIAANADRELRKKIERGVAVEKETERLRIRHEATQVFQQELDADETPALEMHTLASYVSNPAAAPSDLIEGVLKDNGLCIMLGPSGSGKTTLGLQMLHSLLTGDDWLGQPTRKITGSVGVMSYDQDASLTLDWMAGYPGVDPNSVHVVNAYKRGHPLGVPKQRAQIVDAWRKQKVEVVVIDSFSASFFGHDQNDAATTQHHYRDLLKFALTEVEARALIVLVHSTESSPGKARGSTVHQDVADSIVVVELKNTASGQERHVHMGKYRAGRGQHQMSKVIAGHKDPATNLTQLDTGAMSIAGLSLPAGVAAAAFSPLPDAHEPPKGSAPTDITTDDSDSEDEL